MIHELIAYLNDTGRLWALIDGYLDEYRVAAKAVSFVRTDGILEARAPGSSMRAEGNVAVINVSGPIDYRPSIFTAFFGGAAVTSMRADFRSAMADPGVKAVLFAFDSPGGSVVGVSEFANEIMAARGHGKPIVAQIEPMAASAASWLAAAADETVMMPSGMTGALGIIASHADVSGALEREGVKVTTVTAGEFKGEGSSHVPMTEAGLAALQGRADAMYATMVKDVAAGRKVTQTSAREDFGRGRVLTAQQALKAGLVDRLGGMDETLARLSGRKVAAGMRAEGASLETLAAAIEAFEGRRRARLLL